MTICWSRQENCHSIWNNETEYEMKSDNFLPFRRMKWTWRRHFYPTHVSKCLSNNICKSVDNLKCTWFFCYLGSAKVRIWLWCAGRKRRSARPPGDSWRDLRAGSVLCEPAGRKWAECSLLCRRLGLPPPGDLQQFQQDWDYEDTICSWRKGSGRFGQVRRK